MLSSSAISSWHMEAEDSIDLSLSSSIWIESFGFIFKDWIGVERDFRVEDLCWTVKLCEESSG